MSIATRPSGLTEPPRLAQFYIPASASLQERRPRTLKHDDTFALFDPNGDAIAGPGSPEGIFHHDTRHLSHYFLTIADARPILLSSTLRDDNAGLTCDLTNPDLFEQNGRLALEHDLIHLRRSRFLWKAACFERLVVRNFDVSARQVRIQIDFASDFADLFEVRGTRRARRGSMQAAEVGVDRVLLGYTGIDAILRQTCLRFDPAPQELAEDRAAFRLDLAAGEARVIYIEISCNKGTCSERLPRRDFFLALRDSRRALRVAFSRAAMLSSSNQVFNEQAQRSVADLNMLITETPHGPYPYAGIPWFSTVFGRDALITAWQTLWLDPGIARGVLTYLAAHQAIAHDPAADAEPGKILHEVRQGEMALLGEVPFRQYYGSVDSTPLFVMLAGAYFDRTGDVDTIRTLWPNIEAALEWIENDGDRDGDGFVEYHRKTQEGLVNQGWKDSQDSIFHSDGRLARGSIALVEVQAYVYGAWHAAAELARVLGQVRQAASYESKAGLLRQRFDDAFFDRALGTYILALDGEKRPCRVRSSNAGHALFTGIALPERAASVAATLMSGASFTGWGLRTIAAGEARYNPMSYHNGSVWPHDNALIAAGLARYGFQRDVARLFDGLYAASTYIDLRRLPELFCGFTRQRGQGPTFYPVACSPQAWAAATPLSLIQSSLGLEIRGDTGNVTFERPSLPPFLDEVVLRRLTLPSGSVDVALRRSGEEVVVNVLRREGNVTVTTIS